jgi:hypothetical protein
VPTLEKLDTYGQVLVQDGNVVLELVRHAYVNGMFAHSAMLYDIHKVTPGFPKPLDTHPTLTNLRVVRYDVDQHSPSVTGSRCRVKIHYVNFQHVIIRGGTQLVETTTNVRTDGTVVKVPPPVGVGGAKQSPMGRFLEAQSAWSFERFERASQRPVAGLFPNEQPSIGGVSPLEIQRRYAGKTNDRTFLGYERGEVLCESVSYDNTGLGDIAWRMVYEFRRRKNSGIGREDAWATIYAWTDPETGYPKLGTDDLVSSELVFHQDEADFNRLRFSKLQ